MGVDDNEGMVDFSSGSASDANATVWLRLNRLRWSVEAVLDTLPLMKDPFSGRRQDPLDAIGESRFSLWCTQRCDCFVRSRSLRKRLIAALAGRSYQVALIPLFRRYLELSHFNGGAGATTRVDRRRECFVWPSAN